MAGIAALPALAFGPWIVRLFPAPHDVVVMNATVEVKQHVGDAQGLAGVIADGFERQAANRRSSSRRAGP